MHTARVADPDDFAAFRVQARRLLAAQVEPAAVIWTDGPGGSLFDQPAAEQERIATVPRGFVTLAETVAYHRQEARWPLLYEALWRIIHLDNRALLQNAADPLVHRLNRMAAAVRHDEHRMTAFVRFRPVREPGDEHRQDGHGNDGDGNHADSNDRDRGDEPGNDTRYVAWYEPQHRILRRVAPFFVGRFASMRFSILTPDLALHWDGETCRFTPSVSKAAMAEPDAMEEGWKRYYAATFNPARSNPALMARHMPRRFWHNLPETGSIRDLVTGAGRRTRQMINPG